MSCQKCGTEIPATFKFCPECGSNISAISGQSGIEGDVSLGDVRTMAVPPDDVSLGDIRTMQGMAGETVSSGFEDDGESLSDRYTLIEELGRGGFASVWKAKDKKLGRTVAIKKLHPEHDRVSVARFKREARAIAQLNHRNVVGVHDVGEDADGIYLVMEYIDGGTLRDYLKKKGKLELPEALALFRGIAQGLAYAHRKNLVHRDIKPANILLVNDHGSTVTQQESLIPKIVDFGLAQAGRDSEPSAIGALREHAQENFGALCL